MHGWDGAVSEVMPAIELVHVEKDRYEACNSFNAIKRRCLEGASNLKSCLVLHFFSSLTFFTTRVPLKNQRLNPYIAMNRIQVLYRSRFCIGSKPCEELPSIFMALRVERHLVA